MMKHLLNNRGESLAEVLVAVLIIAAGLLALAGMVRVATKSVSNSRTTVNQFYEAENKMESKDKDSVISNDATAKIDNSSVPITIYGDSNKKVYRYEVR